MTVATVYEKVTGRIVGHTDMRSCQGVYAGHALIEGDFDANTYIIRDGAAIQVTPYSLKTTTNKVSGIPRGSRVEYHGSTHGEVQVDDGVLELDLLPGQWVLVVVYPPEQAAQEVRVYG